MRLRRFQVTVLVVVVFGAIAAAAYLTRRSSCVEVGSGLRGEVRVQPDGTTQYFDGRCWTTKPIPPRDMPF